MSSIVAHPQEPLEVRDVADLLHPQYAIVTGGKSRDGCPLITFPDRGNFHLLSDREYQRLMLYLTSVPSLQEADVGFQLIVDRRNDRWNSVKTVLLKISVYFPSLVHVVYVIRPVSFLQKALSEVSNKLFKEEFKFRMIVISSLEELYEYIDPSQLTADFGGSLPYVHSEWIEQRISLEKFSEITHEISNNLSDFTKTINDTEFPNNVDLTQQLLDQQTIIYSSLKEEILAAAKHGEIILGNIKDKSSANSDSSHLITNVFAIERLLVQLEETERTFDEYWQKHIKSLHQCLKLRLFEQDFRELRANLESHIRTVTDMIETGESIERIETLIKETAAFKKLCNYDMERTEEVIETGRELQSVKNFPCPLECVEPKCKELERMKDVLDVALEQRIENLNRCHDIMEDIEKASSWCSKGVDLLASQKLEKCATSPELAEKCLQAVQEFVLSAQEFSEATPSELKGRNFTLFGPETKAVIVQVIQRIEDVSHMCEKRIAWLKQFSQRPQRPVQPVLPEPIVPKQPTTGAPHPNKTAIRKTNAISRMDSAPPAANNGTRNLSPPENDLTLDETQKAKRQHVLCELLETERVYVKELSSILNGYKLEAQSEEMRPLVPAGFLEKIDVIFGNMEELHEFHSQMFLKDLELCIQSTDLVALCFVQKRDQFLKLYSFYCLNIPVSEQLRESVTECDALFRACQVKLGHKLPLAAYLLKPVQRITKYQLLLKDLLRFSPEEHNQRELRQAIDCMLAVLKCVNDSMHQISIVNFPVEVRQQGDLLLQGSFSVWVETKGDLRLRLKPMQRHIFLYQKAIVFCKTTNKTTHNKATYYFKQYLKMSQIGMTETVKGDSRKFEIWLEGRQEVYIIQAPNVDVKNAWVNEIKKVLLNQLEELKGEKIKQYSAQKMLRHTVSWEKNQRNNGNLQQINNGITNPPFVDTRPSNQSEYDDWSSDCSVSDDEEHTNPGVPNARYIALADYCAVSTSEVNMREGDMVELLKVGCAGWWFVRVVGSVVEGWAPAAYLENLHRKTSRSTSHSQDKLNVH